MYDVMDLAKYIVSKCTKDGKSISNLQLQKILYYIQKDFLKNGNPAFNDFIEAWQFGPVVPEVYYHFCGYGAMPIDAIYDIDINDNNIDWIIEKKRQLNPWDMVKETHKPDGAWSKVYQNGKGNHSIIPNRLIQTEG